MDTEANKNQDGNAPAKKGSKLWILIVVVIVWIAAFIWVKPQFDALRSNPIVKDVMSMKDQVLAMEKLTQTQISDQAEHVTAEDLISDASPLKGRYVVVTGMVTEFEGMNVDANIARNMFEDTTWKSFILNEGVVLLDITGESENYPNGSTIKGFGKVFLLRLEDIWDLPYVGEDLKSEFANVEGMEDEVIFFISKGTELIDMVEEDTGEANPCGENPCDDNPCADNPCGENPCGENPCGENPCGENPCG